MQTEKAVTGQEVKERSSEEALLAALTLLRDGFRHLALAQYPSDEDMKRIDQANSV